MCGIWAYISANSSPLPNKVSECVNALRARGPDAVNITTPCKGVTLGFTRLAINGLTEAGMQPLISNDMHVICNGEIYNHIDLATRFNITLHTGSDCEVLSHLFHQLELSTAVQALDGVFACVFVNTVNGEIIVARDPYGVRPLFIGNLRDGGYIFSSEIKGLMPMADLMTSVAPFPPGHIVKFTIESTLTQNSIYPIRYHQTPWLKIPVLSNETIARTALREALTLAVNKRLMAERPIGCLLSGGVDSSLVSALVQHASNSPIHTFCIGMPGSSDLAHAKLVANHIGSIHHEVLLTEDDFFSAIPEVVKAIESYDITTVRASVGNYLVSKYVASNTDIKILMNGDGSDECGSYLYFYNAPSDEEFEAECCRLLDEIHLYDVLRSDRSISSHGLEARTPFLDKQFIATYRAISTSLRRPVVGKRIEKQLLREAFDPSFGCPFELLPSKVLWRKKEAFSDGVSPTATETVKPWHQRISERVYASMTDEILEGETSDNTLKRLCSDYTHCPPTSFESLWYRRIFEKIYGSNSVSVIPHMWLPRWCGNEKDPSATVLSVY